MCSLQRRDTQSEELREGPHSSILEVYHKHAFRNYTQRKTFSSSFFSMQEVILGLPVLSCVSLSHAGGKVWRTWWMGKEKKAGGRAP